MIHFSVILLLNLISLLSWSHQCRQDYYNPRGENPLCTAAKRRLASIRNIRVNKIKTIQEELSRNLVAADINFDGKKDFFRKWHNGKLISISYDSSGDGKVDFQYGFNQEEILQQELMDRNLDGQWDYLKQYQGKNYSESFDTDFNGSFDLIYNYRWSKEGFTRSVQQLEKRSIASAMKPPKIDSFQPDPLIASDQPTEGSSCLEDCYVENVESFFKKNLNAFYAGISDNFEYKPEGDFFKSHGMLIHNSCLKHGGKGSEEKQAKEVDGLIYDAFTQIMSCYYNMLESSSKEQKKVLNTGHIPRFLRTLGIKNENGKAIFGEYKQSRLSKEDRKRKKQCLRAKKSNKNVECYFQEEIKLTCGLNPYTSGGLGSTFPTVLNYLGTNNRTIYLTHPTIDLSNLAPNNIFHEVQRTMGYHDDIDLANAYTHTCDEVCFPRSNYTEKQKKLAKDLCLADPKAYTTCDYFVSLRDLQLSGIFGTPSDRFLHPGACEEKDSKATNPVKEELAQRACQQSKHIQQVCSEKKEALHYIMSSW